MLEVYYSLQLKNFDFNTEVWKEILQSGIKAPINRARNDKEFSVTVGRYFSLKMELQTEDIEESIFQFREYCDYYQHDSWNPLAVEK